jgi:O-antigen ligase
MDGPIWKLIQLLLLLPVFVIPLTIQPEKLFAAWLFAAAFVQGAGSGTHFGHAFFKFLFLVPPLIIAARMAMGAVRLPQRFWLVDWLPALYVAYILIRIHFFPSELTTGGSSLRRVYIDVGVGAIGYYFAAFGKTSDRFPAMVARSLLWGGIVVAVLALVDAATGWNLWHVTIGGGTEVRRAVSTFESPAALGSYLGVGAAFAVAILVFNGPRSLRLPAIIMIAISLPALYFTYTRGPLLGVAIVTVFMALIANRMRWPSLLVFTAVGVLVLAGWQQFSTSASYKHRFGVTETVTTRLAIQHLSLELLREKPVFGWGYRTFDQAKLTVHTRDPRIGNLTSHDTFMTVLVELGVVGLALLLVPWITIGWRAIKAGWCGVDEPWILAGCLGAMASYAIGALTYDLRFFPFVAAMPLMALGLVRNVLAREETSADLSRQLRDTRVKQGRVAEQ